MKPIATLLLLLSFIDTAAAQDASLKGKVISSDSKAIGTATVSILQVADSAWVRSEITDENGFYSFKNIAEGNYLIEVHATGYKKIMQPVNIAKTTVLPDLILQQNATELKEVVVKSKVPYIQNDLGKTIVNVEQSLMNVGSNVLELLRRSPGVMVDGNGNISMNGKQGVLILIDGKQTYLSGDQLADYLKGLSTDMVAQLELITQPSAKYDAEGNAGIINVKTKKNKKNGFNGNNVFTCSQGVYPYIGNNIRLSYKKNKLNLTTDAGFYTATGFLRQHLERTISDVQTGVVQTNFVQNSFFKEKFTDYNLRLGADYNLSGKTTIGASIKGQYHPNNQVDHSGAEISDKLTATDFHNEVVNSRGFLRKNLIANAYLRTEFGKDEELSVDLDYLDHSEHTYQNLRSNNYNASMQPVGTDLVLNDDMPINTAAYSLKADYSKTLKNGIKTEAGIKSSVALVDDENQFTKLENGSWIHDTIRTNHFLYDEYLNAAYINCSKSFGDRWQVQLGLRAEQLNARGNQLTQNLSFTRDQLSLFPTAFVGYKVNEKHQLELNYGRRINRPFYHYLNPFVEYVSQYNFLAGNPQLQPEYTHNIEIKHSYNQKLITVLRYNLVSGIMGDIFRYDNKAKTTTMTIENIAKKIGYGISGSYNEQLFDWWMLSSSWDLYERHFEAEIQKNRIIMEGVAWGIGVDNQFTFKKGWSAQAQYYYGGKSVEGIYATNLPTHWIGFGVAKKVLKDTGTIKVDVSDPLMVYKTGTVRNWPGLYSVNSVKYATQSVAMSFSYNFGRSSENRQRRPDSIEEATRMGM